MNQNYPNYDWVIFQIDNAFKVRDIMTRTRELNFAHDIHDARNKYKSKDFDYDIVPIGNPTNLHSYYDRETDSIEDIKKENLLSIDTGIATLVSLLERKGFYFVLELNFISGFVNIPDLNKLLSFLPLYATSLHAETSLREYFRNKQKTMNQHFELFLTNQFQKISSVADKNGLNNRLNFQRLKNKFDKARKSGFYTDIYDELEFWQELALYYHLNGKLSTQNDWDKVRKFKEIRNRTMHIKDHLPYSNAREYLSQLLSFLQECTDIIHNISNGTP